MSTGRTVQPTALDRCGSTAPRVDSEAACAGEARAKGRNDRCSRRQREEDTALITSARLVGCLTPLLLVVASPDGAQLASCGSIPAEPTTSQVGRRRSSVSLPSPERCSSWLALAAAQHEHRHAAAGSSAPWPRALARPLTAPTHPASHPPDLILSPPCLPSAPTASANLSLLLLPLLPPSLRPSTRLAAGSLLRPAGHRQQGRVSASIKEGERR